MIKKGLPKSLPYTYKNIQYMLNIVLNSFYPTYESMLTVHFGTHNLSMLNSSQKSSVNKIIMVIIS